MDGIKEAFLKVKQDIDFLYFELSNFKAELEEIRGLIIELGEIIKIKDAKRTETAFVQQTNQQTTDKNYSTKKILSSTDNTLFRALKPENIPFSIGNEGVPTDRQTNQQTDRQTFESSYNQDNFNKNEFEDAIRALDSLDNVKKEIRLKFKKLTDQEMQVFSLLYQLSEEQGSTDYKTISQKLNLTESSIRDYIGRLIKKGIPIDKTKLNNKVIQLKISENLKKIVSFQTILQLRGL